MAKVYRAIYFRTSAVPPSSFFKNAYSVDFIFFCRARLVTISDIFTSSSFPIELQRSCMVCSGLLLSEASKFCLMARSLSKNCIRQFIAELIIFNPPPPLHKSIKYMARVKYRLLKIKKGNFIPFRSRCCLVSCGQSAAVMVRHPVVLT